MPTVLLLLWMSTSESNIVYNVYESTNSMRPTYAQGAFIKSNSIWQLKEATPVMKSDLYNWRAVGHTTNTYYYLTNHGRINSTNNFSFYIVAASNTVTRIESER